MAEPILVSWNFSHQCFGCGRTVHVRNGNPNRHHCWLHPLSKRLWRAYLEGWHSAHRFAVENADDPMVLADAHDYGSGWAGFMRQGRDEGAVRLPVGDDQ